jgi:hypothetical protein
MNQACQGNLNIEMKHPNKCAKWRNHRLIRFLVIEITRTGAPPEGDRIHENRSVFTDVRNTAGLVFLVTAQ